MELVGIVTDVVGLRVWDVAGIVGMEVCVCAADVWFLNEFCECTFDATVETTFTLNVVSAVYAEKNIYISLQ